MAVCNKDCFNCIYPDCICDSMDSADYKAAAERDRATGQKRRYIRSEDKIIDSEGRKEYWRLYYHENKEWINARRREKRAENPERYSAEKRRYYLSHREKCIENAKEWQRNNKEKARASRKKYYEKNKERISEQRKQKRRQQRSEKT